MKISVVMTTYNGEKYLTEQLDSLRNQSRLPDEVIICDDGSSDTTNSLVDDYIKKYSLNGWIHKVNEVNLGWRKNFMEAIRMSSGELIFTCDQDDIWYADKLEIMEKAMQENKKIQLLVSDYDSEYKDSKKIYQSDCIYRYEFDKKFMFIKRPGCVYCFRRELFDTAETMWFDYYPHDAVLWRAALVTDSLYVYKQPLIYWRRHETTATGHDKRDAESKIVSMEYYLEAIDKLIEFIENNKIENKKQKKMLIDRCREWCELRIDLMKTGKLSKWIKLSGYIGNYYNCKSYLADLVMAKNK
ncbi:MAG: glycosyltransferase [Oscillospiraceae bacterium]|nr:glycosyltransferase [Oscillospiraceae bacterium]